MVKQKKNSDKSSPQTASKSQFKPLADYLQQQRRNRHLSVRKVAQLTNLPESTIRALENPNKSKLPSSNTLGLYQVYGQTLGVTDRRIRDLAGVDEDTKPRFEVKKLPKLKRLVIFSNITTSVVVVLIIVAVAAYASWQGLGLFSSPELSVAYPDQPYLIVDESSLTVEGQAPREASVLVNGQPTAVDGETGEFSQVIFLQVGYNYLTVEAVNSFSTRTEQTFVIFYKRAPVTAVHY